MPGLQTMLYVVAVAPYSPLYMNMNVTYIKGKAYIADDGADDGLWWEVWDEDGDDAACLLGGCLRNGDEGGEGQEGCS